MPQVKVNSQDLEALHSMIEQARLIVDGDPIIPGGIERARELLATAEKLAGFLACDSSITAAPKKPFLPQ